MTQDPIDEFIALPREQQLSTLQSFSPEKQDKLLSKVKDRRSKTKGPAPKTGAPPVTGEQPSHIDAAITEFSRPRTAQEVKSDLPGALGSIDTNLEQTAQNVGRRALGGVANMVAHPINTLVGAYDTAKEAIGTPAIQTADGTNLFGGKQGGPLEDRVKQFQDEYAKSPRTAIENLSGDVLGMYLSGKLLDAAGNAVKPMTKGLAPRVARAVTGTGPKAVTDLVERTREENTEIAEKTAKDRSATDKANAKLAEDRAAELKDFHEKTQARKAAEEKRSGVVTRRSALESGIGKLSDKFQDDLKATRDKAAAEADAKYQKLNEALGEHQTDGEFFNDALSEAAEKIKGTETEPTIFKDIEKKMGRGESFTYGDLQGYYSELGRELKKGTLPGDVYTAYGSLQDSIGGEMQRIADTQGMGPELADARSSWRQLRETFYDRKSPIRKALEGKEAGAAIKQLLGKDRTGIEAIARYDPGLAQRANTIRGYQEELGSTRVPAESTRPAPQLGGRSPAVPYPEAAPPKTIGPDEVRAAKTESLADRAARAKSRGFSAMASGFAAYDAIRSALNGDWRRVGVDVAARGSVALAQHGIARLLTSKPVIEYLTTATARDAASIPEDLRGKLPDLVKEAKARGIRVSPSLNVLFGSQGVNGQGPAPRAQQNATDAYQQEPR